MFTVQEYAQIWSEYHQTRSIVLTKSWTHRKLQMSFWHLAYIIGWERSILEPGNIEYRCGNGRPENSNETIQQAKKLFRNDTTLSIHTAFSRSQLSPTKLYRPLRKCAFVFSYNQQTSAIDICCLLFYADHGFLGTYIKPCFSDEGMFRINGVVNKQAIRISAVECPGEHNVVPIKSPSDMTSCAI